VLGAAPELLGGAVGGQVQGDDVDRDAVALDQLPLQRPQPVLAPRDQRDVGAAAGQLAGEVGPEPAGRARDQRMPSLQRGSAAHRFLLVAVRNLHILRVEALWSLFWRSSLRRSHGNGSP